MRNLVIGTDVIEIKDAIRKIDHNISELQEKLQNVRLTDYAAIQIRKFYEDKIKSQRITLDWLMKAM